MKINFILPVFALIFIVAAGASASFKTGVSTTVIKAEGLKTLYGGGANLSYSITPLFCIGYKGYYALNKEERTINPGDYNVDVTYNHMAHLAGIEYYVPLILLEQTRFKWRINAYIGRSWTESKAEASFGEGEVSDSGLTMQAGTGIDYVYKQNWIPFIEIEWFKSANEEELSTSKIRGFQFNAGLKYSFGSIRSIKENY